MIERRAKIAGAFVIAGVGLRTACGDCPRLPGRPYRGTTVESIYISKVPQPLASILRYACSFPVKVISHPDNSTSFEVIESQLKNPLIDADHQDLLAMKQIPVPGGQHHKTHHKRNQTDDHDRE